MQLLISDANILIDLEEGQILELLFHLPYQFKVPDILFEEELKAHHAHLAGLGLQIGELTAETMMDAFALIQQYGGPSRNDCFALALARQEQCPLLTGDKALRKAAESESVMVKGTLWVVEQMVQQNLLDKIEAHRAYDRMEQAGRRLPWAMARQRLDNL